ncbi:MAG TPA: ATP-binding protein [Candidatus Binatia bacterium]|jgi:CheY-like chemotaxis protein/two-component sensor histidine kinase
MERGIAQEEFARQHNSRVHGELLEQARAVNHAQADFLALLAHELRNPLAAISSAAQLLAVARSDEERTLPESVIQRQVAHLARLVDELMDTARASAGDIALERRPVILGEAVERALDLLRAGMNPAWHVIEVDADEVSVDADPQRLEQIVLELVGNAIKYTPAGRRIRIIVRDEGEKASLRVEDEGVGIAPSALPKIFGLFVQSQRTADRVAGGLGIGLTLVRMLVELHGGSVEASSEGPGRGSVFTVRLPVADVAGTAPSYGPAPSATSRRILIVEDNDDARQMLRVLLERQGHEVFEAADGAEGLRMAINLQPDLAFIDIGLPIFNGYELARLIRESTGSGRLIALTGYGQPEDRQRSRGAGFDDHLVKPVTPRRLLDVLAKAEDDEAGGERWTGELP